MSLFDHRNFLNPFGFLRSVVYPPVLGALQWLTGMKSDQISLLDNLDIVNPEPVVRDVNVIQMGTGSKITSGVGIPLFDWYYSIWMHPTATGTYDEIIMSSGRNGGLAKSIPLRFFASTFEPACRVIDGSYRAGASNVIPINTWSRVISKRVSGVITFEAYDVSGTQLFTAEAGTDATSLDVGTIELGAFTSGRDYDGLIGQFQYGSSEASKVIVPFEEGNSPSYATNVPNSLFTHSNISYTNSDGPPSFIASEGFYVAAQDTVPYIPALVGDLVAGVAVKSGNNPVYTAATTGNFDSQVRYCSAIKVSDTDWRMFLFQRTGNGGTKYITYKTSTDGITWVDPILNLVSFGGNTNNNIVMEGEGSTDVIEYSATHWLILTEEYTLGNRLWTMPKDMSTAPVLLKDLTDITLSNEAKCIQARTDGRFVILCTEGQANPGMRSTRRWLSDTSDLTGSWSDMGLIPTFTAADVNNQFYSHAITVVGDVWYSVYSNYNGTTQLSTMGLATSDDEGTTWSIIDPGLVGLGANGTWDDSVLWSDRFYPDGPNYRSYYMGLEDPHYSPTGKDGAIGYFALNLTAASELAANGEAITNAKGVHNNGPHTIQQTATDPNAFDGASFWGGGVDVLQELTGVDVDGITLIDALDIVNPEPVVRDAGCMAFQSQGSGDTATAIEGELNYFKKIGYDSIVDSGVLTVEWGGKSDAAAASFMVLMGNQSAPNTKGFRLSRGGASKFYTFFYSEWSAGFTTYVDDFGDHDYKIINDFDAQTAQLWVDGTMEEQLGPLAKPKHNVQSTFNWVLGNRPTSSAPYYGTIRYMKMTIGTDVVLDLRGGALTDYGPHGNHFSAGTLTLAEYRSYLGGTTDFKSESAMHGYTAYDTQALNRYTPTSTVKTTSGGLYIGGPSMAQVGSKIFCSADYFGTTRGDGVLYSTSDNGATWDHEVDYTNSWLGKLVTVQGVMYRIAGYGDWGNLIIEKWTGTDFSAPVTLKTGGFEPAPTNTVIANGKVIVSFNSRYDAVGGGQVWAMQCDETADLMVPGNWTISNPMNSTTMTQGSLDWTQEVNVVEMPNGDIKLYGRVSSRSNPAYMMRGMNVMSYNVATNVLSYDGYMEFDTSEAKQFIIKDPVTSKYFIFHNRGTQMESRQERDVLSMSVSDDAVNWTFVTDLMWDVEFTGVTSIAKIGYQYPTPFIDGNNIILTVRTANDGAPDYHNSYKVTSHTITNFRDLLNTPASSTPIELPNTEPKLLGISRGIQRVKHVEGGAVHNGAIGTLQQTSATYDDFGGACVWGDGTSTWDKVSFDDLIAASGSLGTSVVTEVTDGVTVITKAEQASASGGVSWDKKTKAEFDAQWLTNGWHNLWLKVEDESVLEAKQFSMDKLFTPAEAKSALDEFGTGGTPTYDAGLPILDEDGWIVYYTPPTPMKSVVFDIPDYYDGGTFMGIRSIEFKNGGTLIALTESDFTAYHTSALSEIDTTAAKAFDTTLSKSGLSTTGTSWVSGISETSDQRIIVVFDTEQTFDEIVINNYHTEGTQTNHGVKNVKITASTDSISDTTYNAAISNSTVLNDTIWPEHNLTDGADDQIVWPA